jgi:hypothetical protein
MTAAAWQRLDQLHGVTKPRAIGEILERALEPLPDWQDWQIRKEKQLLDRAS